MSGCEDGGMVKCRQTIYKVNNSTEPILGMVTKILVPISLTHLIIKIKKNNIDI